jgi:putative membrane protein
VAIAGLYGALTASKKIFFVQALPALIALGVTIGAKLICCKVGG